MQRLLTSSLTYHFCHQNDQFCQRMQIICDMAGMPLTIPEPFQCSSYGDAMLAALGVGALESFAALRAALPQGRILQPDRKNHEFYQEHYPIFRDLYLENRDRMHRMQK